jgi:hypothetical protein
MKKLIYSTLSIALAAVVLLSGCKGDDGNGSGTNNTPKPTITFQNNNGTFTGYTFADGSLETGTDIKIGVRISSEVNLKTFRMTQKLNSDAEVTVPSIFPDSTFTSNTKTCNKDISFKLPSTKGTYTYTFYATDKDQTTSSATIRIVVFGPLLEVVDQTVYNNKGAGFGAYDLIGNENISTADNTNTSVRDIIDQSTSDLLSLKWKSGNNTRFIKTTFTKTYTQIKSTDDIIALWNANTANISDMVSNIAIGDLILAKVERGGQYTYMVIGISQVEDVTGRDDDFVQFFFKY